MRVNFKYRLSDILELNRTAREQRIKAWIVIAFAVGLGFVGVWFTLFQDNQHDPLAVFEIAGLFLIIGIGAPWIAGFGAWFLKTSRDPYEIEFKPDGVVISCGSKRTDLAWKDFRRWYKTPKLLVLVGYGDAIGIPNRCCNTSDWKTLEELIRCGLGEAARC